MLVTQLHTLEPADARDTKFITTLAATPQSIFL